MKEEIKAATINMWDAIEKGDIERYANYVHPDFTQFGETDSVLLVGKAAEVNGAVFYWSDAGTTNGKAFKSRGKSTRIFVKENGKWLCIHGHYTLLSSD